MTVNGAVYQQILNENLLPSMHPDGNYVFMQDNAPCHIAPSTIEWLEQHNINFGIDWPPQSPDLNPIENLWDHIDRKVHSRTYRNVEELWKAIQDAWTSIPRDLIENLVDSLPNRIDEVKNNRGNPTRY